MDIQGNAKGLLRPQNIGRKIAVIEVLFLVFDRKSIAPFSPSLRTLRSSSHAASLGEGVGRVANPSKAVGTTCHRGRDKVVGSPCELNALDATKVVQARRGQREYLHVDSTLIHEPYTIPRSDRPADPPISPKCRSRAASWSAKWRGRPSPSNITREEMFFNSNYFHLCSHVLPETWPSTENCKKTTQRPDPFARARGKRVAVLLFVVDVFVVVADVFRDFPTRL